MSVVVGPFSIDRAVRAVEKVKERLLRAASSLEAAKVPYAIADGHAVAFWVSRADESALRNTRDVDLLIRREDLAAVRNALEAPDSSIVIPPVLTCSSTVQRASRARGYTLFSRPKRFARTNRQRIPTVTDAEKAEGFRVLSLKALVQIKLTAFRDKDRVHLRDLIDVGLVDESWVAQLPPRLGDRLQQLLNNPE